MNILRFDRKELTRILTCFASGIKKHPDVYTRTILLDPSVDPGRCSLIMRAPDNRFTADIEILNTACRIDRQIVFELRPFLSLLLEQKDDHVTIQEDDKKLTLSFRNGVVGIENYMRMGQKIRDDNFWKSRGYKEIHGKSVNLLDFISVAQKAMTFANTSEYRRVGIDSGKGYMNFGNTAITYDGVLLDQIGFRAADFPVIKASLKDTEDFFFQIFNRDFIFTVGKMKFSVPMIKFKDILNVKKIVDTWEEKSSIIIETATILDTLRIVSKMFQGGDTVVIDSRGNHSFIEASGKTGRRLSVPVGQGSSGAFTVKLSADMLKKTASTLSVVKKDSDTVKIILTTDRRVIFSAGCLQITMGVFG